MATLAMAGAWMLFGGSHLLLSWPPVRAALCARLGTRRFVAIYGLVATVTSTVLAVTVAILGDHGPRAPNLAATTAVRVGLTVVALLGAALATAGLLNYPRSPMAVLARRLAARHEDRQRPLRAPAAVERITRHPFFVGLALLMGAHALLATTWPAALFFAGFTLLALLGMPMQDRKLRARHGELYSAHLAATSAVPLAALSRSSRPVERLWPAVLTAVGGAALLAALHPLWRFGNGALFVALITLGGAYGVARQAWRGRDR